MRERLERTVPIAKVDESRRLVYGVVYEPNVPDAHDDMMTADEIEKACHGFGQRLATQRAAIGLEHQVDLAPERVAVVENYIAASTFRLGPQTVAKGSWVLVTKVLDDQIWADVKAKRYTGYSFEGWGQRVPLDKEAAPMASDNYVPGERQIFMKLVAMGITAAKAEQLAPGFAELLRAEPKPTEESLRSAVRKAVVDYLGREPISKLEEVQARKEIYDANPGLQRAVFAEERIERLGQGRGSQPDQFHATCPKCGEPAGNAIALGGKCPHCGAQLGQQKSAGGRAVRDQVSAMVVDLLGGRAPIGKSEEIAARRKVYRANPGLADAAYREEAAERHAAGAGHNDD